MKIRLLFLILIIIPFNIYCQQGMNYTKVITAEDKDAQRLYSDAKTWFASEFNYPGKVIQIDDPTQKMISGRSNITYSYNKLSYLAYDGWVHFTILIQCKDGRLRCQLQNISHENKPRSDSKCSLGLILDTDQQFTKGSLKGFNNNVCADIKNKMKVISEEIFNSLEIFIKNSKSIVNDEW